MEEEINMISNSTTNANWEAANSNRRNQPCNNCSRHVSNVSASKFKGVISQPNGNWGAQIYANHQRIWLGTFRSEMEAARAYDSAAMKLRSGDSHRNYPWAEMTAQELKFQNQFSTDAVLSLIKDGSYSSRFSEFQEVHYQGGKLDIGCSIVPAPGGGAMLSRKLFHKELTPSDVGKLSRLVIPKKDAMMYFPRIPDGAEENKPGGGADIMSLVFYDNWMRLWQFRYSYWKSSRSFVFTKGWSRFVKEKELKEKDMVIFSACECRDGSNGVHTFYSIDVGSCDCVKSNSDGVEEINQGQGVSQLYHGQNIDENEGGEETNEEEELVETSSTKSNAEKKGLRLFGIQII